MTWLVVSGIPYIKGVISADDDLLPSSSLMRCLVGTWGRAPERIVGIDLRKIGMRPNATTPAGAPAAVYAFPNAASLPDAEEAKRMYSMVLTKTMIYHRRFMRLYADDAGIMSGVGPVKSRSTRHRHAL
jgi:hypothetical protein